ncbi:hypothetical protein GGF46_002266 [Coemansia sp. RSA 552]|nr:hypothetical protein GGF46_002266 [Coemansia sp. RSA 552]
MIARAVPPARRLVGVVGRGISTSQQRRFEFPLSGPSWSVGTLLKKPRDATKAQGMEDDLSQKEIAHLYTLSGLRMPDPAKEPHKFAQISAEVNQLRDFLSHIQVAREHSNLDAVEPLVRIAEPVNFTIDESDGDLAPSDSSAENVGQRVLHAAEQKSGPYFIVEK